MKNVFVSRSIHHNLDNYFSKFWHFSQQNFVDVCLSILLQSLGRETISFQENRLQNWRAYLSDEHYMLTNFVYMPERRNSKALPAHNSFIKLESAKNGPVQRVGYFHLFEGK